MNVDAEDINNEFQSILSLGFASNIFFPWSTFWTMFVRCRETESDRYWRQWIQSKPSIVVDVIYFQEIESLHCMFKTRKTRVEGSFVQWSRQRTLAFLFHKNEIRSAMRWNVDHITSHQIRFRPFQEKRTFQEKVVVLNTHLHIPHNQFRRSSLTEGFREWELFTKEYGLLAQLHKQNHTNSDGIHSRCDESQIMMITLMFKRLRKPRSHFREGKVSWLVGRFVRGVVEEMWAGVRAVNYQKSYRWSGSPAWIAPLKRKLKRKAFGWDSGGNRAEVRNLAIVIGTVR
jgi:hypothetical protein